MKLKNIAILSVTAFSLGAGLAATQTTASAATWHRSAIPAAFRGTWYGKYTGQKLYVYRHTIRYSGEHAMTHVQWAYRGNKFYRFRGNRYSDSTLFHYFNRHKISTMSMEHYFLR